MKFETDEPNTIEIFNCLKNIVESIYINSDQKTILPICNTLHQDYLDIQTHQLFADDVDNPGKPRPMLRLVMHSNEINKF